MKILKNDQYLLQCHRCQSRIGLDFQVTFQFQLTFQFKRLKRQDGTKSNDIFIHPQKAQFNLTIPIFTKTICDPICYMTPKKMYDQGIDINHSGGDIILSGFKYQLPNIPSYPYNKPIVVDADSRNQVTRCEFIRQTDPLFGNTYHIVYAITKNKSKKDKSTKDKVFTNDIIVNIREIHDGRFLQQTINKLIYVPINLLFYAYGAQNDEEIFNICNHQQSEQFQLFLINTFRQGFYTSNYPKKYTAQEAKQEIAKLILQEEYYSEIDQILEKYVNPLTDQFLIQLGEIVNKMYLVFSKQEPEQNKQDLRNKRIMTVANQVVGEVRSKLYENYRQQIHNLSKSINDKTFDQIVASNGTLINNNLMSSIDILQTEFEKSIKRSFTSVNSNNQTSNLKKQQNEQKTKNLEEQQKREIVYRQEMANVNVEWVKRKVQTTYWGYIDPIQTPESGKDVGCYLSPNLYTYITISYSPQKVINFLKNNSLVLQKFKKNCMPVKVNYIIVGFVEYDNVFQLYNQLMNFRQQNLWLYNDQNYLKYTDNADQLFVSIYYDIEEKYIGINTDSGRLMTPIITPNLKDKKDLYLQQFKDLLSSGKIIWICPDMIQNFIVHEWSDKWTVGKDYALLPQGLSAAFNLINPFTGYMKSVRAMMFTSQAKQSIQLPATNFMANCSGTQLISHQLQYAPIDTPASRSLYKKWPIGNLVYNMLAQYTFNQEDAFIANEAYIQRNGLSSSEYKVYQQTQTKSSEQFGIMKETANNYENRLCNNEHFMCDKIGSSIHYGDTLIWKIIKIGANRQLVDHKKLTYPQNCIQKYSACSNVMNKSLEPIVNTKMVRVQLARYPIIGDKIISKNCQKGTIGKILKEYEMPICESGIVPSFITSCPSILKRETYGQMIEPLYNKWLIREKQYTDDVSMDKLIPNINQKLITVENDIMYSKTGQKITEPIMAGPMLFCSQTHLVSRKIRACDESGIEQITRQPQAGMKNGGAMKYGVQEETAQECAGICEVLKNQAGLNSSNIKWYYCKKCHYDTVYYDILEDSYICPKCGKISHNELGHGSLNYSEQLLSQILWSIGIGMKFYDQ